MAKRVKGFSNESRAFASVLEANNNNAICHSTSCIFFLACCKDPGRLSGVTLLFTALLFTVIIIINKRFHSASSRNALFIILTVIVWIIGVGLISPPLEWIDRIIAANVALLITIHAIFFGINLEHSARKLRIVLFIICCSLLVAGIIFSYLAEVHRFLKHNIFEILSLISWCGGMFMVILLTIYYLVK
ncbi:unnamed protein product [Schistosoma turkestanicum]|nr:unnamed protein product [Schistosoma turkestanicum]